MPPATEPIPQMILENLQTALGAADGGSDYFYDLNVVKIGEDIFQAAYYPAVTIGIGEMGRLYENKEGRVLWAGNFRWSLSVIGAIEGYTDGPKRLIRMFHDIYRAVMADYTRGGVALNTIVTGAEMLPPADGDDTRSWLEVGVEVHFRTKDTTLLTGV